MSMSKDAEENINQMSNQNTDYCESDLEDACEQSTSSPKRLRLEKPETKIEEK